MLEIEKALDVIGEIGGGLKIAARKVFCSGGGRFFAFARSMFGPARQSPSGCRFTTRVRLLIEFNEHIDL